MPSCSFLAVTAVFTVVAIAQTTTFSPACLRNPSLTTFPACNSFLNSNIGCSTVLDRVGKQNCICHQAYLDAAFGCENEVRLCFLNNNLDQSFESAVSIWHSLCDGYVTFKPTTQASSAFTRHQDDFCLITVVDSCNTARSIINSCLTEYGTDIETSRWSSCTCAPQLLSHGYTCQFLGNTSCLATGATISNVNGYTCSNWGSDIGTGPPPVTFPTLTGTLPTLPTTTTNPTRPDGPTSLLPTTTTTGIGSGGATIDNRAIVLPALLLLLGFRHLLLSLAIGPGEGRSFDVM